MSQLEGAYVPSSRIVAEQSHLLAVGGGVAATYLTGGIHHHYAADAADSTALGNWQPVADANLVGLGVHRARAGGTDGSVLPPYVLRDVDDRVRDELRIAAESGGFVLLTGDSTAGKSRTALEAVKEVLPRHLLLAPSREADLRLLRRAPDERAYDRHILWLDDLERYLGPGGLEPSLLTSLIRSRLVVLSTLRDERYDTLRETADEISCDGGSNRMTADSGLRVLNMVEPIVVRRLWSKAELARVALVDDDRMHEAYARHGIHGIAEYLAAGPELLVEWRRAARATAKGGHPRGAALVAAAVDLARVGLVGDLPMPALQEAHHDYLKTLGGAVLRPEPYADAFAWASQVRFGVASLLMEGEEEDSKRPFDYLVDAVARDVEAPDIPDSVWLIALKYADSGTRPLVAQVATFSGQWAIAEQAWRPLVETGDEEAIINYTTVRMIAGADTAEIEPLLRPVAEAGIAPAQLNLAGLLKMRGAEEEAERWWREAAEGGLVLASFNLYVHYWNKGDQGKAEAWLRRAAEGGFVKAITILATLLHVRGDESEAEPWWQAGAMAGDPEAMYVHGHLLRLRGDDQAELWLRRAAEQGHDRAAEILGRAADERGEVTEAEKWWRAAAEAENAEAANQLGVLLSTQDKRDEGKVWYAKGAERGHKVAMFNLAVRLSEEGDDEGAKEWYRRSGEAGHLESFNNLGVLLREEGDLIGAETALRQAADVGDPMGYLNLIDLLVCDGRSREAKPLFLELICDPDGSNEIISFAEFLRLQGRSTVAQTILQWAAEAGWVDAAHNLGTYFYWQKMPSEAEYWWRVAAPAVSASAFNLGSLLFKRGNREEAVFWWTKAANEGHQDATIRLASWLIESGDTEEVTERLRDLVDELPEFAFVLARLQSEERDGQAEAKYWWLEERRDAETAFACASYFAADGDQERTEFWCRKSAEAGHPQAAHNLGALLAARGLLSEAESWFAEAVRRGFEGSAQPLAQIRSWLSGVPDASDLPGRVRAVHLPLE
ncbi:tetratricopeptide repeat protein [Streptomyces sp. NPDC002144]